MDSLVFLGIGVCGVIGFVLMRIALLIFFRWERMSRLLISKMEELVAERIRHFLSKVKEQIPMSSVVLRGDVEQRLMDQAKDEVMHVVPDVEKALVIPLGCIGALIGMLAGAFQTLF